jgi:glycine/D-amino acid oxidase-like deaminating enzyme
MAATGEAVDGVVLGGGFYGLVAARELARHGWRTVLVEQAPALMRRASYHNQARVHRGYHYPRSVLTAARSCVNYSRFLSEFGPSVRGGIRTLYAVAAQRSKVNARQFEAVFERVGAPLVPATREERSLFDPHLIEEVYFADEAVFDAAALARLMQQQCEEAGVRILLGTTARALQPAGIGIEVELEGPDGPRCIKASKVLSCLYSGTNRVLAASGLPPLRLKHELTEMPLIEVPPELRGRGVTVMCGPFFSTLPFPDRDAYTLSHVHHTPHFEWHEEGAPDPTLHGRAAQPDRASSFERMRADAARYLPVLSKCRQRGSLWETKTVLPASESDDSRPIVYRRDHGVPGLNVVLGAKIDNVFDLIDYLRQDLSP